MYYYDAGLMPLQSKLKKMLDTILPDSVKLYKGKVVLQDYSVFYKFNFGVQKHSGEKVIGNIYEITQPAREILNYVFGGSDFIKVDGLDVYTPIIRSYCNPTGYTNIKNIPNLKWKYETEDKIQAPKL